MKKNIFAKVNERKISEIKAGIDWLLESYEENKRELEEYGRRKFLLYYYTNWIGNNQGSEMLLRRITYNSVPYVKE